MMTNKDKAKDYEIPELKEAFLAGCEWKEEQMIEKAVEWIKSQMIPYGTSPLAIFNYIEDFKQTMKDE